MSSQTQTAGELYALLEQKGTAAVDADQALALEEATEEQHVQRQEALGELEETITAAESHLTLQEEGPQKTAFQERLIWAREIRDQIGQGAVNNPTHSDTPAADGGTSLEDRLRGIAGQPRTTENSGASVTPSPSTYTSAFPNGDNNGTGAAWASDLIPGTSLSRQDFRALVLESVNEVRGGANRSQAGTDDQLSLFQQALSQNNARYERAGANRWAAEMMERRRPVHKFNHQFGEVDFETQLETFRTAADCAGAEPELQLTELPFWFGDIAYIRIQKYLRRKDYAVALREAFVELTKAYGKKRETAQEILHNLLKGPALQSTDLIGISRFISKLSELYDVAMGTGRSSELEREETQADILRRKLPFWKNAWIKHQSKQMVFYQKVVGFQDMIQFLAMNYEVELKVNSVHGTIRKPTSPPENAPRNYNGARVATYHPINVTPEDWENGGSDAYSGTLPPDLPEDFPEDDYAEIAQCNVATEAKTSRTTDCLYCSGKHALLACRAFRTALTGVQRCHFARDHRLCLVCGKTGHRRVYCEKRISSGRCRTPDCGQFHHQVFCPQLKEVQMSVCEVESHTFNSQGHPKN